MKTKKNVKPIFEVDYLFDYQERSHKTFDDLYRIFKGTRRGLNPKPESRGEENPLFTGKAKARGFKLIELALAYPQSLVDSFNNINGVKVDHWVKRFC